MAVELPAVVIEADAAPIAKPLSVLRESERRALAAFTDATGIRLGEVKSAASLPVLPIDPGRSGRLSRVEETLRAAREPLDLGERDAVSELRVAVAVAYAEARAHPEDPEAPFLVGEALRTLARIEELAGDVAGARALRERADRLDGGRRIGLSEGGPSSPLPAESVPITITLRDATARTALFLDGERRDPSAPIALAPGEHHVRVAVDEGTIVAQWITVASAGPNALTLAGGAPPVACSTADLAPALNKDTFAITCPRWARIARRADALEVRVCTASSCEPPSLWSTKPAVTTPSPPPQASVLGSKWTWIGVGAAAIVGGTLAAWGLGAFDRDERPPPTWRWEGAR